MPPTEPQNFPDKLPALTRQYYQRDLQQHYQQIDRMFAWLMPCQWVGAIGVALWLSPLTWRGQHHELHPHVWAAVVLIGLLTMVPVILVKYCAGSRLTRLCIAVGQAMTSAILIHLTYGRIETHFHIFGSLAFLALYRDWSVLLTASFFVVCDHALRGWLSPAMIYGTAEASLLRFLEHSWWIAFEDLFLIYSGVISRREMRLTAERQAVLHLTNNTIEDEVRCRTSELQTSRDQIAQQAAALEHQAGELIVARDQAQESSRVKSEFLANMSHEIRTPLTAILGFTDTLREEPALRTAPAQCREMLETIRGSGSHLLRILNDILDLSKIEANHLELEHTTVDLPALLRNLVHQFQALAQGKKVQLSAKLLTPIPSQIRGDADRLRQILINLVSNALKFTETGSITVEVQYARDARDLQSSAHLLIDVRDTGCGINPELVNRLFCSFSQVDAAMNRRYGGTGLGLKIARQLARLMQGDVTLLSTTPHLGSCFRFTLPIQLPASVALSDSLEQPPVNLVTPASAAPLSPPLSAKILLVEDGPDNQRLIRLILEKAGATVQVAGDGVAALQLLDAPDSTKSPVDLILTDMQMPVMDGYTLARTLRERGDTRPIIALTAHAMAEDRLRCLESGCDDYCTKPINRSQLLEVLRSRIKAADLVEQPTSHYPTAIA